MTSDPKPKSESGLESGLARAGRNVEAMAGDVARGAEAVGALNRREVGQQVASEDPTELVRVYELLHRIAERVRREQGETP